MTFGHFISRQTTLSKKFSQTPHAYSMIIKFVSSIDCGFIVKVVIMHPFLDYRVFLLIHERTDCVTTY